MPGPLAGVRQRKMQNLELQVGHYHSLSLEQDRPKEPTPASDSEKPRCLDSVQSESVGRGQQSRLHFLVSR